MYKRQVLDIPWVLYIRLQFFAYISNVYRDRVVGGGEIWLIPHALIDILDREDFIPVGGQQMENLIFNIRQKDFFVISQNLMGIRINAQVLNMYTGCLLYTSRCV